MRDWATSPVLLALYRAARELPAQSFEGRALHLIKPLLSFGSSIWGAALVAELVPASESYEGSPLQARTDVFGLRNTAF
jgi:hypothetical protein